MSDLSSWFYPDPRGFWFFAVAFVVLGVIRFLISSTERK